MKRLPATTDDLRGMRAARWIRESTEDQFDRYGPAAQRDLQDRAIARLGLMDSGLSWSVAESGSTVHRSPDMQAMLEAARSGRFDVLVVAYVARWQRNLRQTLNLLEDDLHPAGVAVYFADEELLSSCERHWDTLVDEAKGADSWLRKHRRRVKEGLAAKLKTKRDPGGRPPLGFRRNDTKLMEPDDTKLPLVRHVFTLSADGRTDREVSAETGVPLFTVRGMLTSPLYIGRLRDGGPANWPPLIDLETWNRVQDKRARRATNSGRPAYPSRPYSLPMLRCAACGRRLTGDTAYYRHRDPCHGFLAAQPLLPPTQGRHAKGRGYPMTWYEDAVGDLLEQASVGAELAAEIVAELRDGAAPDPVHLARIQRERSAATAKLERDRDTDAWQATMRRLDEEESEAGRAIREAIPADRVVAYLRELPETWRQAAGGRGRRMVAESLFSGIGAWGFRELEFELTSNAVALGLAEALPAGRLELRVPGYGRGERS